MKKRLERLLDLMMLFACLMGPNTFAQVRQKPGPVISVTLIPPSPVTDKITLDIRGALWNKTDKTRKYQVSIYLDTGGRERKLFHRTVEAGAGSAVGVRYFWPTKGRTGRYNILMVAKSGRDTLREIQPVTILASKVRSDKRISGAWVGITHWSEQEGKPWNSEIKRMNDAQWKQLVREMHRIGMNIIVIQEVFRNQVYNYEDSLIALKGYQGRAYYPSKLFPGRMPIAAKDPIGAILSEADQLGMHVFLGVGMYAWFDFSPASLVWHERVAKELWQLYGYHPSFYGWYVSEEKDGSLGDSTERRQIVDFFKEFTPYVRHLAPDKPVMLAINCFHLRGARNTYIKLLPNLDILCPFGFDRMPKGDETAFQAASLLQKLCRKTRTHLWLDMEVFVFGKRGALIPRPISGVLKDLQKYTSFEETLCYQYPGLMTSPGASIKLGGLRAVKLYIDYQTYLRGLTK